MDKLFDIKIQIDLYQSKDKRHFSTLTKEYDYMPFEKTLIAQNLIDQVIIQILLHPGQPFAIQYDVEDTPYISSLKEKTFTIVD
jgi:hypothetical protein